MAKKEDAKKKTVAKKAPVKKTAVKKATPAKKTTKVAPPKKVTAVKKSAPKKVAPKVVAKKVPAKKAPVKVAPKKAVPTKKVTSKKTTEKVAKKETSLKGKKKIVGSLNKELESEDSKDELTDSSEKMVAEELSDEEKRKQKRKNKLEKKIQKLGSDANRSLSKYLQEISKYDPLLPEREVELAIAVKQGSRRALKELVEANLRFVVSVAKDYQGQGLPLTDLINEGNLGLIKASERFDETRGFKFISYAVWWIRQSILQALAEHSRIVRLPLNRVGTISKINKAAERLEQEFERSPRADELARQLDMKPKEVNDAQRISRRHHSLDTPFSDDDKNCLMDVIEDNKTEAPDKELLMDSLQEEVSAALDTLKEREREVIRMYFGIDREYALTLNEIGEEFGLTRERVRQIKEKAIRRLRHRSRSRKLRQYLG
jgi:RNA polymerase primary sigma factor